MLSHFWTEKSIFVSQENKEDAPPDDTNDYEEETAQMDEESITELVFGINSQRNERSQELLYHSFLPFSFFFFLCQLQSIDLFFVEIE